MMELIYRLYRFLAQHRLCPDDIKITIEFTNPETQHRAECLLMREAYGVHFDQKMIEGIIAGNPWKMYGINFQAKRFQYPKPCNSGYHGCQCPTCQEWRRDHWARTSDGSRTSG